MSRSSITLLLCLPPMAIIAIIIWCVGFIAACRRSFGAHSEIPVGAVVGAAMLLVLHAGYFAAPWLVHAGRTGLSLALMAPAALAALGLVLFLLGFDTPSSDTSMSDLWGFVPVRTAVLAGTAIVYQDHWFWLLQRRPIFHERHRLCITSFPGVLTPLHMTIP